MAKLALIAALSALALPALAAADALPNCPPGTHMVMNDTPPGAMHHGGGRCDPDDPASPTAPAATAPVAAPVSATTPSPAPAASSGMCSASAHGERGTPRSALMIGALVIGAAVLVRRAR